jgi:hypothetical protein
MIYDARSLCQPQYDGLSQGSARPMTANNDEQTAPVTKMLVYSDDKGIRSIAKSVDIPVISFAELPLPPETAQKELPLGPPPKDPNDVDIEEELKQEIQRPGPPLGSEPGR